MRATTSRSGGRSPRLAKTVHKACASAYNCCGCNRTPAMFTRLLLPAFTLVLAGTFGLQQAHADIYTWVDASGIVNVSNLAPPEGVRPTKVIRESAPNTKARDDAARDAARQAEVQALAERVRQLQDEVDRARRQVPVPMQMDYRPIPPPAIPYEVEPTPPPAQYAANVAPSTSFGCDLGWMGCGLGWGQALYPPSIVVLRTTNFRRFPMVHGGRHFAAQRPGHVSGGFRRR
ncbi:MAG: DUF4124 domain-containing protein [Betaproteobacteria bacterium]|nr:MAG: DUF4124 domain-containing protein [Betaproteobacteria bacterium]